MRAAADPRSRPPGLHARAVPSTSEASRARHHAPARAARRTRRTQPARSTRRASPRVRGTRGRAGTAHSVAESLTPRRRSARAPPPRRLPTQLSPSPAGAPPWSRNDGTAHSCSSPDRRPGDRSKPPPTPRLWRPARRARGSSRGSPLRRWPCPEVYLSKSWTRTFVLKVSLRCLASPSIERSVMPDAGPTPPAPLAELNAESEDEAVLGEDEIETLLAGAPWQRFVLLGDSIAEGISEPVAGYLERPWGDRVADGLRRVHPSLKYKNLGYRFLRAEEV